MDTYILMPEREFKKCQEKIPDFDDSVSAILKQPFTSQTKKAEALQNALGQYLSLNKTDDKNLHKVDVLVETEPQGPLQPASIAESELEKKKNIVPKPPLPPKANTKRKPARTSPINLRPLKQVGTGKLCLW